MPAPNPPQGDAVGGWIRAEAIAIGREQIRYWQRSGLKPREAWAALTGEQRPYVGWKHCFGFIVVWELRRARVPFRRAA